ncbi:DUF6544 family protein [Ekhidna sp.]
MLRYLYAFLLLFHGWIHLLGFVKAFNLATVSQLQKKISKPFGILWLIIGLLFIYLALSFLAHEDWYFFGFMAVALSQLLIFIFWQDAKAASLVNLLVFSVALVQYAEDRFQQQYEQDVTEQFERQVIEEELITQEDLKHLPHVVAKYLNYVGVVGHPRIKSMKVSMNGKMRKKEGAWFHFKSSQYNFFDESSRFFFMKAKVSGLPTYGYHSYHDMVSQMQVRVMALFPVMDEEGETLFKAETVTFLNDLCILAPAALINENISWKVINDTTAEATLTNKGISVSATLHFNKDGQLVNFVSEDRYDLDRRKYRYSTPISDYKNFNGYHLPSYGEAIWHYPDGEFVYGEFNIQEINYNQTNEYAIYR